MDCEASLAFKNSIAFEIPNPRYGLQIAPAYYQSVIQDIYLYKLYSNF